jgi:hypothetical protein
MTKTMNMPRFTAEAALFKSKGYFHAAQEATAYSGTVQPARARDWGLPCLKFEYDCDQGPCRWIATEGRVGPFGCQ